MEDNQWRLSSTFSFVRKTIYLPEKLQGDIVIMLKKLKITLEDHSTILLPTLFSVIIVATISIFYYVDFSTLPIRETTAVLLLIIQTISAIILAKGVIKAKSGNGISLMNELVGVSGAILWVIYGIAKGSEAVAISGAIGAITYGLVAAFTWKYKKNSERGKGFLLSMMILGGMSLTLVYGIHAMSIALSIFCILQFLPQGIETYKNIKYRESVEGVSVLGCSFRVAFFVSWLFYSGAWFMWGFPVSDIDWPVVAWGISGTIIFGSQLINAILYKRSKMDASETDSIENAIKGKRRHQNNSMHDDLLSHRNTEQRAGEHRKFDAHQPSFSFNVIDDDTSL